MFRNTSKAKDRKRTLPRPAADGFACRRADFLGKSEKGEAVPVFLLTFGEKADKILGKQGHNAQNRTSTRL